MYYSNNPFKITSGFFWRKNEKQPLARSKEMARYETRKPESQPASLVSLPPATVAPKIQAGTKLIMLEFGEAQSINHPWLPTPPPPSPPAWWAPNSRSDRDWLENKRLTWKHALYVEHRKSKKKYMKKRDLWWTWKKRIEDDRAQWMRRATSSVARIYLQFAAFIYFNLFRAVQLGTRVPLLTAFLFTANMLHGFEPDKPPQRLLAATLLRRKM